MRRKQNYPLSSVAIRLWNIGVIDRDWNTGRMTIDVDKLVGMKDEEILTYRNIGPVTIKRINEAREALKELLIK